jgi:hypothetical protein
MTSRERGGGRIHDGRLCAVVVAAGLWSCTPSLPVISTYVGAEDVVVVTDRSRMPGDCQLGRRINAEDGMIGADRWHYDGTEERAMLKLRNAAIEAGANAIFLDKPASESIQDIVFEGARGSIVRVSGIAYSCPGIKLMPD